jgi:hypothetical protein
MLPQHWQQLLLRSALPSHFWPWKAEACHHCEAGGGQLQVEHTHSRLHTFLFQLLKISVFPVSYSWQAGHLKVVDGCLPNRQQQQLRLSTMG